MDGFTEPQVSLPRSDGGVRGVDRTARRRTFTGMVGNNRTLW